LGLALSRMGLVDGKAAIYHDCNSFGALLMSRTTFEERNFSAVKDKCSIDRRNIFQYCNMLILTNRQRETFHLFPVHTRTLSNPMAQHNLLREPTKGGFFATS
jgi:hypothetical protein